MFYNYEKSIVTVVTVTAVTILFVACFILCIYLL